MEKDISIQHKKTGFTLLELVTVLAIISILITFAYPSYQNHLIRGRRCDGQSALLDLANRMEQYYAINNTYQTATLNVIHQQHSPEKHYALAITHATDNTYTLQATPIGPQGKNDTQCQSLTLNHLSEKGICSGPAGMPTGIISQCW